MGPLIGWLRRVRRRVRASRVRPLLQKAGVSRAARRAYNGMVLRRGTHTAEVLGERLTFAVSSAREVERIDCDYDTEAELVERMVAALPRGGVFFDVGGNIGGITLLVLAKAARRDGEAATAHAFEPEPRNAAHLRENLALNGWSGRATAHELALGREDGAIRLYVSGEAGVGTHSVGANGAGGEALDVPLRKGDAVVAELGRPPDVVKIDVEGAEMEVLLGLEGTLRARRVGRVFLEIHPGRIVTEGYDEARMLAWLAERGYRPVWSHRRRDEVHHELAAG